MDYKQLKQWLQNELPINRKERFYTGTVLPSILFHNGLSNLFRFLREIEGFPEDINENTTQDNFLFYTEYNLKETAGKKSVGAEIITGSGDTPDVIIEILKPRVFVVIEAKMFANLTQEDFGKQIAAQKRSVTEILKTKYKLDDKQIFHIGLTPRELCFNTTFDYQIINWEFLLESKDINREGNYFVDFLRFAIERYDELVSRKWGTASTVEGQMTGFDVYQNGQTENPLWIGRKGGIHTIKEDVKKGIWRTKNYVINSQKPMGGQKGNWISSQEFAEIIDSGLAMLEANNE